MEIDAEVRTYVVENFLAGANGVTLDDATPLITGGLIDSIGMIGLVRFVERRFGIEFKPKELDAHRLDTIEKITRLIQTKLETVR
jgi:acyl carrier protein